jgi:hypothetical protein
MAKKQKKSWKRVLHSKRRQRNDPDFQASKAELEALEMPRLTQPWFFVMS